MAPKKSRIEPVGEAANQPSQQPQTSRALSRNDETGFEDVAPKHRRACFEYEILREAVSEEPEVARTYPPWLSLPLQERQRLARQSKQVGEHWCVREPTWLDALRAKDPVAYDRAFKDGWFSIHRLGEVVKLDIDWSASDERLKQGFEKWLAERRSRRESLAWKFKKPRRSGRPSHENDQLLDLAIYRTKKAGFDTTDDINEQLGLLLKKLEIKKVDAQRIYDACKRVLKWMSKTGA